MSTTTDERLSFIRAVASRSPGAREQYADWMQENDCGPYWTHDCESCVYLGQCCDPNDDHRYDAYQCLTSGSTVARGGDDGSAYISLNGGISVREVWGETYPMLSDARRLAVEAGFNVVSD